MDKIQFKCWYCPAVYSDFKALVFHFEEKHRLKDEHIVLEVTEDMVRRKELKHKEKHNARNKV